MKVLWLTSWYPNSFNITNGDFVQRHAQATSFFCKIDVIHVEAVPGDSLKSKVLIRSTQQKNFTETIVAYKPSALPVFKKIISYRKYLKLFKQQIRNYINTNGKPDVVHVHVAMKAGLAALWIKRKFKINYMVTEHSTMFTGNANDVYKNRSRFFKKFTKRIFKKASLILPVSKNLGEAIEAIVPVNFSVIYNCVNTDYFFYDENFREKNFTFIHVSTLNDKKNPHDIIEAFIYFNQQYPNSKLIVVGQITAELSKYLSKLKYTVSTIQFTGFVSYETVAQFMQQSNCLILFSKQENMPCVILEALCCGLAVISSDVGGVNEVVDKENGLIAPDYTTESLIQTMTKMYNDYKFYNRKKIAADAKAKFAYDVIGSEILNKYKEVCNIIE